MSSPATRIRDHAAARPDAIALRDKHLGVWREWTWATYWEHIEARRQRPERARRRAR
ncbi:hypothetical protein [Nocardioides sp. B-3]|uniref:hypothetical protein n=1 Tax=Nocardioides sp. B-3 TaxID=2895565 RepID=UPI00215223D8|nr:hypothetical protein [Nocardioides sp. B-3]UUZ61380.1 hypothetical protein LP418_12870 [Nocardioides sp. B-3]